MFNSKQTKLFTAKESTTTSANSFVATAMKTTSVVRSENGAKKYSTSGNDFIDQFTSLGSYKVKRSFDDISRDMSTLWAGNARLTVAFVFFIRIITRTVMLFDGSKTDTVQRGGGLRHEGIMRMIWLHIYHKDVFWKNIHLYIAAGSWKDIILMLSYDLQFNGWEKRKLDWNQFGSLLLAGLENPNHSELIKKYLPQIKTNSKCKTLDAQADNIIAKWICSLLFGDKISSDANSYKHYRKLKSAGTAHQWQQLISKGKHLDINFDTVHGRALSLLVSSKYLANNGLESKYQAWIESKPVAKFTGFVHELFEKVTNRSEKYQIDTLNSQFKSLVETAQKNATTNTSLIVVRDTSGSMGAIAEGTKSSCFNVAKSLALFFSEMLPNGYFSNSFIEFNSTAMMHQWKGSTPFEKYNNDRCNFVGSTNFQSVIQLFANLKSQGVKESEFPSGILCISDMEFNPSHLNQTNVATALQVLTRAGFSKDYVDNFKIVLWNVYRKQTVKFETINTHKNTYYFSGFDGSIIAFLTGVEGSNIQPQNAEELFNVSMDQSLMQMIQM